MKTQLIFPEMYRTTNWSGGKTTEMFIAPEGADYQTRNFGVRVSSATIDDERSVFTKLPGVERELVLLEGSMDLEIDGEIVSMDSYAMIGFPGESEVISHGKVRDFNLMLKDGAQGDIGVHEIVETEYYRLRKNELPAYCLFYLDKGNVRISVQNETFLLSDRCLLVLTSPEPTEIKIDNLTEASLPLLIVRINHV